MFPLLGNAGSFVTIDRALLLLLLATGLCAVGTVFGFVVSYYEPESRAFLLPSDMPMIQPPEEGEDFWSTWIPELVIEVVSPGSELRDYQEKREEYLAFGVHEYWIFDADKQEMLVLQRVGGRWREKVVRPPEIYQTRVLPGLQFSCASVFQAANRADN